jgi:hypothetical protein
MNPNRLNVALSRSESLAIVVGHPGLARTRCSTLDQMKLVNLYCRIDDRKAERWGSCPRISLQIGNNWNRVEPSV